MSSMQYPNASWFACRRVPASSADSPVLRHQESATAVPLNLSAGDTAKPCDFAFSTPNEKDVLLVCNVCGLSPPLRKIHLMNKSRG